MKLQIGDAEEVSKIYYSIVNDSEKIDFRRIIEEQDKDDTCRSQVWEK